MATARGFIQLSGNVPQMLSKSRFCRRLHKLEDLSSSLFFQICHCLKAIAGAATYVLDSFPVAVCNNIRISKSRIVKGKKWQGKHCSMRRYFYGVKVQVLTTSEGIPVKFCFVPGSESDVKALAKLPLAVGAESCIYADAAYTDYQAEDDLMESENLRLLVSRKSNSKRPDEQCLAYLKNKCEKVLKQLLAL